MMNLKTHFRIRLKIQNHPFSAYLYLAKHNTDTHLKTVNFSS